MIHAERSLTDYTGGRQAVWAKRPSAGQRLLFRRQQEASRTLRRIPLTPGQRRVANCLLYRLRPVSYAELAVWCGISARTAMRAVAILEAEGVIHVTRRPGRCTKYWRKNLYTLARNAPRPLPDCDERCAVYRALQRRGRRLTRVTVDLRTSTFARRQEGENPEEWEQRRALRARRGPLCSCCGRPGAPLWSRCPACGASSDGELQRERLMQSIEARVYSTMPIHHHVSGRPRDHDHRIILRIDRVRALRPADAITWYERAGRFAARR